MGSDNQPDLSESEREVLRVLWDRGPETVREINVELTRRGRRWAYTTVATLLQRLCAPSGTRRVTHRRFHMLFRAAVTHATRSWSVGSKTRPKRKLCDGRSAPLVPGPGAGRPLLRRGAGAAAASLLDQAAAGGIQEPPKSKAKPRPKSNA